jgi:hypothetical protein
VATYISLAPPYQLQSSIPFEPGILEHSVLLRSILSGPKLGVLHRVHQRGLDPGESLRKRTIYRTTLLYHGQYRQRHTQPSLKHVRHRSLPMFGLQISDTLSDLVTWVTVFSRMIRLSIVSVDSRPAEEARTFAMRSREDETPIGKF